MNKSASAETIAKTLDVTLSQVKAGLKRNASVMRAYSDKDLSCWGKTREQANCIAKDYEMRAV